ncbi:unnamed protein product [Adineta steineri]|uniref:Uncharacterized protein n=1 Tax=Adineta steineri TaxID=433720 RepID=A0A815TLB6_9BILA|nr:unnamed protein product [Adineta steineri]
MDEMNATADEILISNRLSQPKSRPSVMISCFKKIFLIIPFIILFILFILTLFLHKHVLYSWINNNATTRSGYRTAHCMTGIPRTLYKEELYVAYRRQAPNKLPGDLFVILELMNKTDTIHGVTITDNQPKKYTAALKYLTPRKIEWIPSNNRLGALHDEHGYAKWQRCLEHIEQAEKQDGIKYDFIVRTRPDLYIAKDLPTVDLLPKNRILINPYYEFFQDMPSGYNHTWPDLQAPVNKTDFGISSLFAIIPRSLADSYMRVAYTPNLPRHICGSRAKDGDCAIRAALYKANITFELWPFVIRIMYPAQFCHAKDEDWFNSWC